MNPLLVGAENHLGDNPFLPHRWLRNGNLQTVVGSQQRRQFPWGWAKCKTDRLELGNGSQVDVTYLVRDARRPTLIAIHGMAGSSQSLYMQALSHKAFRQGWNFALPSLYNVEPHPSRPKIFHAGCSREIEDIIKIFSRRHSLRALVLVGVSMGGNIVLKMLGEWGKDCPGFVRAAAAISPLVDLMSSWSILDQRSNLLYRWYYLRRLRRLALRRSNLMGRFLDMDKLKRVNTIRAFDELFTAPLSGYQGAFDYYQKVSSISVLPRINVPTLVIHSKDDPLLPWQPLARPEISQNHSLLVHMTRHGGHVAFIARAPGQDVDRAWAENRVIDFFSIAAEADDG